jgi:hypothetical protein
MMTFRNDPLLYSSREIVTSVSEATTDNTSPVAEIEFLNQLQRAPLGGYVTFGPGDTAQKHE